MMQYVESLSFFVVKQVWLEFKVGLLCVTTCCRNTEVQICTYLSIQKHIRARTYANTRSQVYPPIVFLSSTVTIRVTDFISPTICWLEAQCRRSYPGWQIQTTSVYACFSQGLTQYGRVESLSRPPCLHLYQGLGYYKEDRTPLGLQDYTTFICTFKCKTLILLKAIFNRRKSLEKVKHSAAGTLPQFTNISQGITGIFNFPFHSNCGRKFM